MLNHQYTQQRPVLLTLMKLVVGLAACAMHSIAIASDTYQTEKAKIKVEEVVRGLNSPWSIAFVSANDWLVTERGGKLRRVVNGELLAKPIAGVPKVAARGQGGLLDVALHPDFAENQTVYLSYAGAGANGSGTEVVKAKLVDNTLVDSEVIFVALPKQGGGRHYGSRLVFDKAGYLYISLGDRGNKNISQDTLSHAGSIIRLNDDGTVPQDNPFVGDAAVKPEIFSTGHRNVQGMTYDPQTDLLWSHEHGPQGGDELNQVAAGKNYGWPTITYGVNYGSGTAIGEGTAKPGLEQPVYFWDPSIAPSGMAIVNSDKFPQWKNNILVGALKYQLIARLEMLNGQVVHEERLFEGKYGRIRDVRQGPDNNLYFITDSSNGSIYRISSAAN
jgi:glucose/arabinose dehydrogenase